MSLIWCDFRSIAVRLKSNIPFSIHFRCRRRKGSEVFEWRQIIENSKPVTFQPGLCHSHSERIIWFRKLSKKVVQDRWGLYTTTAWLLKGAESLIWTSAQNMRTLLWSIFVNIRCPGFAAPPTNSIALLSARIYKLSFNVQQQQKQKRRILLIQHIPYSSGIFCQELIL